MTTSLARRRTPDHFGRRLAASITLALTIVALHTVPASAGAMPLVLLAHESSNGSEVGGKTVVVTDSDNANRITFSAQNAMTSFDARYVASANEDSDSAHTTVTVSDPWRNKQIWSRTVPGSWRVEALSNDGGLVVLGDPSVSPSPTAVPKGRSQTRLQLVDNYGSRLIQLFGNFVAEAVLADRTGVALIEYMPAQKPTSYQVRKLITFPKARALGSLGSLGRIKIGLADEAAEGTEDMAGTRITHAWHTKGEAIYTLYDAAGYPGNEGVFVHALDLKTAVASCLDVPASIDAGKGKGRVVYSLGKIVVIGTKGMARLDARTGAVEQIVRTPMNAIGAAFARDTGVFITSGRLLLRYDLSTLIRQSRTEFPNPIAAGSYLLVALSDEDLDRWTRATTFFVLRNTTRSEWRRAAAWKRMVGQLAGTTPD